VGIESNLTQWKGLCPERGAAKTPEAFLDPPSKLGLRRIAEEGAQVRRATRARSEIAIEIDFVRQKRL